jgi:mannose-1-phosphate guanylyltransferase
MTSMKGFVLAAGFGERMRPITESVPKPLLPVGNLPLIGYALKLLAHHGITDVIVNLHHLGKQLEDALGDGAAYGVKITYSYEEEILGTGGGLKRMQAELQDTFVVVNSDTIIDVDLHAAIATHRAQKAVATMVLRSDPGQGEYGQIEIDGANRIRRILGNGKADEPLRSLMFAGVHVIEPQLLDYIPPDLNTCVIRYAYAKALANGAVLAGHESSGYWADAGTPERYLAANADALDQRIEMRHADALAGYALAPKKEVGEVIRMGDDVELGADARLVPPVVLGDGARIGGRSVVGPYVVVGARARIGDEAKVSHAVLLEGVKVEGGAEKRGVVIGKKGEVSLASAKPLRPAV